MEAVLTMNEVGGKTIPDVETLALRGQLYSVIEQLTWGGARQFATNLTPFKLTLQQYFTLMAISQLDGCTMSALAARTHHSFGTMTGIVDRLVRQDLVVRQSHATDRRVVIVRLTPEGAETLMHIEEMRAAQFDSVVDSLGELQAHNLIRLLSQYVDAAGLANTEETMSVFA